MTHYNYLPMQASYVKKGIDLHDFAKVEIFFNEGGKQESQKRTLELE